MIHHYGDMGVLEQQPGPGEPEFPASLQVENLPSQTQDRLTGLAQTAFGVAKEESAYEADHLDLTGIEKVNRFPSGLRR